MAVTNERITCRALSYDGKQGRKKLNEARKTPLVVTSVLWFRDLFNNKDY